MIGNLRAFVTGLAVGFAWVGAAAAADCLAYIDAQAVHDEAIAEAESVYKKAMAPITADHRKARADAEAYVTATVVPALKAHKEAERAERKAYDAWRRAEIAGRQYKNKEMKKHRHKWFDVLPAVEKKVRDTFTGPARRALEAARAAASATYDQVEAVHAATKQANDEALATANARYEAASAPHRTALEEAKHQARAELEGRYIEIYSAGRDVSGYRRESVLKAAQGEFLNLCSQ